MSDVKLDRSLLKILQNKSPGTLAIFERSDNFACYGSDAKLIASCVFQSEAGIKTIQLHTENADILPYLPISKHQYQRVIREALTILRYRVELYCLDTNDDNAKEWILKAKGTAGNAADFEDVIGETTVSGTLAVKIIDGNENRVSICCVDINELGISVAEFIDTPTFQQTERILLGLCPHECLILHPFAAEKKKKLATVLKNLGIVMTEYDLMGKSLEETTNIIKDKEQANLSKNLKECLQAVSDYMRLPDELNFHGKFSVRNYGTNGFVYIDTAAVTSLELFHLFHAMSDVRAGGTLYGILNKCSTPAGQRLLREWLAHPLCDIRLLTERQDVVSALVESSGIRDMLRSRLLPKIPDCSVYSRKFIQNRAKLMDCYRVYQAVMILPEFEKYLNQLMEENEKCQSAVKELMLEPIIYASANFVKYVELIMNTVEEDQTSGGYRVKPDVDPQLLEIDGKMQEIRRKLEKMQKKMSSAVGVDVVLESNDKIGYYFRVSLKNEKELRSVNGITVIETSKSSGCKFKNAQLEELNEEYLSLNSRYQSTQGDLEKQIVTTCGTFAPILCQLNSTLSNIDVLVALATVADTSPAGYVRPKLLPAGSGILRFEDCRHPVIEAFSETPFIPNTVDISKDKRLMILTGSNMGGKSTYLRSAALCTLMAQIGSFVPATCATVSLVDGIYTRIGASDQQTKGVSTFMAEMSDCANILSLATENSLVIVDELGRGTSTFDGFGLAWGIASHILKQIRCMCLFATHFHEIGTLAKEDGAFAMQMSVVLHEGRLTMLYELREGVAGSSFGIEVAKMVGLPGEIVKNSYKILSELEGEKDLVEKLKKLNGEELRAALLA
ncbi:hypothetical protein WR25_27006 [Diploscapter pachys]|uniref:DNA mismatch repair proteins mutS family domain-containing protein n=1 Tax=Diploscapter pachys TaxID=2018661 RepID=A0A2A2L7E9_9BILA|nr:hypothetical protein WR25_27006 [Diploscapter pachys]